MDEFERLFPFCKIVSGFKGTLKFQEENLVKLITANNLGDLPTAIISIIGPASSGKSFLTNLLINYYQLQAEGGWLLKILKKQEQIGGFLFGSVNEYPGILKPSNEDLATPGIYMWPKQFVVENCGKKLAVWVLHLVRGVEDDDLSIMALERFLMVASSRLAEIDVGMREMRILKHKQYLNGLPESVKMCTSIVYIFRSGATTSVTAGTDAEAKEELSKMLLGRVEKDLDGAILEGFDHLNIIKMRESLEPLHDAKGRLNADFKGISKLLRPVIETIADDGEVGPKKMNGEVLKVADLRKYFKDCFEIVNKMGFRNSLNPSGMSLRLLETCLDEIADEYPPLSPKIQAEDKDSFVFVSAKDCDDSKASSNGFRSPGPLTKQQLSEEECLGKAGTFPEQDKLVKDEKMDLEVIPDVPLPPESDEDIQPMDVDEDTTQEAASKLEKELKRKEADKATKDEAKKEKAKQEREHMLNCADTASADLRNNFYPFVSNWIKQNLDLETIAEIESCYESSIKNYVDNIRFGIAHQLIYEFLKLLQENVKDKCKKSLRLVKSSLEEFRSEVRRKFDNFTCFTPEKCGEICGEIQTKLVQRHENDDELLGLVWEGCEKLKIKFFKLNEDINKSEVRIAQDLRSEVVTFYTKEMNRFIQEDIYSQSDFAAIHSKLIGKILDVLRTAFGGNISERVKLEVDSLGAFLTSDFPKYQEKNLAKTKQLNDAIQKITQAARKSYNEAIEKVLEDNPNGLEHHVLRRKQDEIVNEVVAHLKTELKNKLNQEGGPHVDNLLFHTQEYFKEVLKENEKFVGRRKEREEKEKREEQERLRAEERQRLEKEEERKKNEKGKRLEAEARNASTPIKASPKIEKKRSSPSPEASILPPLVFQLDSRKIWMGMCLDGKPTILKSSGEDSTPFLVAFGKDEQFLYGFEAEAKKDDEILKRWWIGDYFLDGECPFSEKIRFPNGDMHTIGVEFLLGFILNRLKDQVERDLGGKCSTTVITIPFKFTSSQRLQVKQGGIIAGFTQVHLVTEISALAYYHANWEGRRTPVKNFVVMTEENEIIEAFVYAHNYTLDRLALVSHSGNYCLEEADGIVAYVMQKAKQGKDLVLGRRKESELVRSVFKEAVKQADKYPAKQSWFEHGAPTEFYFTSKGSYGNLLEDFGKSHTSFVSKIFEEAAILGACKLAGKCTKINEIVRDRVAFDVMRATDLDSVKKLFSRRDQLPEGEMRLAAQLPSKKSEGEYYQEAFGSRILIGHLKVKVERFCLTPNLYIDSEGIVKFRNVELYSISNLFQGFAKPNDCVWKSPNLCEKEMTRLKSLIDIIPKECAEDESVTEARGVLSDKCTLMREKLESGGYKKMRTSIAKKLLMEKITEGVAYAQHAKVTLDQLEFQLNALNEWEAKYI